jgi:hypothetical protein
MTENTCKYVCSRGILKSCKYKLLALPHEYYGEIDSPDIKNMKDGDTLYISIDLFKTINIKLLDMIPCRAVLVCGDQDETFPSDIFTDSDSFDKFIESDKIIHVFSQNCEIDHSKVSRIPIGLDYHSIYVFDEYWGVKSMLPIEQENEIMKLRKFARPFWERMVKCYTTFHLHIYDVDESRYGFDRIEALRDIPSDCVYYEPKPITRPDTHKKQLEYAFVISPLGNGMDCHRTWEALILGCIPIVRSSPIDGLFEDLPVLIVDNWSDINQQLLDKTVLEYRNKNFNYDKLQLKYWMNIVNSKSRVDSCDCYIFKNS